MMESRKNPDEMSAHERLDEIAVILFQALMRTKISQKSYAHKEGLGSARTIRDRISALASKGHVKFFKNADAYGLPLLPRSRQGYLCVDGMTLKNGALVMATHMKHPDTGEIIPIADLFNGGVL